MRGMKGRARRFSMWGKGIDTKSSIDRDCVGVETSPISQDQDFMKTFIQPIMLYGLQEGNVGVRAAKMRSFQAIPPMRHLERVFQISPLLEDVVPANVANIFC